MSLIPLSTSNSKRRRLIKALLFVGVVCLFAFVFQYFFEKKVILGSESGAAYKVNRILYQQHPNEIPIFGPSLAKADLIPSVLGPDFFDYGIDGIRDDVVLFFLEQECRKQRANRHLVAVFAMEGFTYGLGDLTAYIPNSNSPAVKNLLGDDYKLYYSIPFIKYYGQYDNYLKDYLNERMMLTKYKDRGASIEKDIITPDKFSAMVRNRMNTVSRFANDSVLEQRFVRLVRDHPERDFVILIPPFHPSYFNKFENYDDALRFFSYLSQFPNIQVLNYSHQFYPDDCYLNTTHLNYKGAVLFNQLIKDTLQKIIAE
jgi:hypothetical protein